MSTEVALHNYKAAQKEYRDLQPKASQLRVEFLQQELLSPGLSDENQQAIRHILTAERSRETFRAIRRLKNVQPMSSVSQIEVPGPDGPLHITSQQEVEQHISEALALRFQLTAHSPFLVDPLRFELGLLGTSPASLPHLAQLNILADWLAKRSLLRLLQHCQRRVGMLVSDAWSLMVNNQMVTLDPHPRILWHLGYRAAYNYMVEKKQYISPAGFPLINFPALSTALKATSPLYRLWFSKFVSGHSATGRMMHLWGKLDNALCPCCGHDPETTRHVLICPDPRMHLEYHSKVLLLEQWLSSVDTMPEIQFCLLQGLCMEQPSLFSPFASPSTQAAAQAQDHIGWVNLLLGQLATEWSTLQHYHLTSVSSCRTSSSWATGVVTHLLAISHSLWVFRNQVVHDWTMEGTACAAELQVAQDLHAQFALGLQDLPFSEQHYIESHSVDSLLRAPLTDRQHWLTHVALARQIGQQQRQAGIQGMQATLQDFLNPPPPVPP